MTEQDPDRRRAGSPAGAAGPDRRRRVAAFGILVVACLTLAVGYAWWATARRAALVRPVALPAIGSLAEVAPPPATETETATPTADAAPRPPTAEGAEPAAPPAPPGRAGRDGVPVTDPAADGAAPATVVLLRHTSLDQSFGVVSVHRRDAGGDTRRASDLRCDRLYFRNDRGVCLTTDRVYTTHAVMVFDRTFTPIHRLPLNGIPSRVRVSPDGRLAAVTVFVTGHSYADAGFSTETSIIDTRAGTRLVGDLETFEIRRDNRRVRAIDINFWGVTFAGDSDRFYATLATGGVPYLVEGRVSTGRVTVIAADVECPSLSPDQTRIAFKRRASTGPGAFWRLHVMDLDTGDTWPLAEDRSVDDQVEWLDDETVLYQLPDPAAPTPLVTDVWMVPADGGGAPARRLRGAASPVVLRD